MAKPKHRAPIDLSDVDEDLLSDLGRQSLKEISQLRRHDRIDVKLDVHVWPGNTSDTGRFDARGHTRNVSRGGFRCILPRAPIVGDVYRIQIHDPESALPMTFALCLRCRLLRVDSFDCAFEFFSPLDAPEISGQSEHVDLLD